MSDHCLGFAGVLAVVLAAAPGGLPPAHAAPVSVIECKDHGADLRAKAGAPLQLGGGFLAYDPGFTGGVQAAFAMTRLGLFVVTGVGSGGGPHIKLFRVTDLQAGAVTQVGPGFMAYDPGFLGGARVAATADPEGNLLVVTGVGSGGGAHVKVFRVTSLATGAVVQLGDGFFAYDPGFLGGVNVGAR